MQLSILHAQAHRGILIAVSIALFLAAMDSTIVAPALPTIQVTFSNHSSWPWIMTGFLLPIAFMAPLVGSLADIFGALTVFRVSIGIFLIASLGASLAHTMALLISARIIQGVGAGGIIVLAYTLLGSLYPPEQRAKMQGLLSAVWGLAAVIGPVLGSLILLTLGWRGIFWLNLPVGLIALALSHRLNLPRHVNQSKSSIDGWAQSLSIIAIVSWLLSLNAPWPQHIVELNIVVVAIVSTILVIIRIRANPSRSPIPLAIFMQPSLRCMTLLMLLSSANIYATVTLLPSVLVHSHSMLSPGILITVAALGWVGGAIICAKLLNTNNQLFMLLSGSVGLIIGPLGIAMSLNQGRWALPCALLISALATGIVAATTLVWIQNSAPPSALGRWTAAVQLFRNLGSVCGISLLTGLYTHALTARTCFIILALLMSMGIICTRYLFTSKRRQHESIH
ncbi:MFS transporter [Celerinatantimonas yamalensis]|uniref:MFS transporter n=1 Tax=Celerinatantimonas yamalensis TaxID=559956 RepID=A0ABW9G7C2_9GAMM